MAFLPVIIVFLLYFSGIPIAYALFASSLFYFGVLNTGSPTDLILQKFITSTQSFPLLAIPFFVMAGAIMNYAGISTKLMSFADVLTGHLPGGLAQVNVLLSMLMGGVSGSANADAAMQCKMLVPTMESKGYSKSFSTVITAASGMVVPLIPPGVGLIIYGCINNISIGKLFIAGIGPGIVLCVTLMIFTHFLSKKRGYLPSRTTKIPVSEKIAAVRPAFLPLLLPIIIIGGVRIGIFTASEAGTVAIVYAVLLGLLYKELTLKNVMQGCKETVTTTASIMLIVAAATCFSWILTKEQIPQQFSQWMISNIHNKYVFLIMVNIFLLIVGMFIEGNASMIVLAPLLHPVAMAYGIDDIHFAMVYIFNCTIGAFTPPMGTLMFVSCGITKCPTKDFIKEAVPFYILFAIDIIVLTYIPQLTTFLVNVFY